jgi:hypothetical protein
MVRWLGSGNCVPEQRVPLAQTFLTGGAASLWRAKSAALQSQGFDILDWGIFARILETAFGHQDLEQNASLQVGYPEAEWYGGGIREQVLVSGC